MTSNVTSLAGPAPRQASLQGLPPATTAKAKAKAKTAQADLQVSDSYSGPRSVERRPILLYNDGCQVCRVLSTWVKAQDAKGKDLIDERPIGHDPEALTALNPNLDIWEVYETIHMIMPDGQVKKGGEAIAEVFKRLPTTSPFAGLFDVSVFGAKPFQRLLDVGYIALDRLRPAIGCESCGGGPVAWWAKPVKWTADAVRAVRRVFTPKPE